MDIVIQATVGSHQLLVCIECHDRARKATVEWVEQMSAKHGALPTAKLILVAANGFTATARAKAATLGIDACSLEQTAAADWTAILGASLAFNMFAFRIVRCHLIVADRPVPADRPLALFNADDSPKSTLGELIDGATSLSEPFTDKALEATAGADLPTTVFCQLNFTPRFYIANSAGTLCCVDQVFIALEVHACGSSAFATSRYRDTPMAYAAGKTPIGEYVMSFVRPDVAVPVGTFSVQDKVTGDVHTVAVRMSEPGSSKPAFIVDPIRINRDEA